MVGRQKRLTVAARVAGVKAVVEDVGSTGLFGLHVTANHRANQTWSDGQVLVVVHHFTGDLEAVGQLNVGVPRRGAFTGGLVLDGLTFSRLTRVTQTNDFLIFLESLSGLRVVENLGPLWFMVSIRITKNLVQTNKQVLGETVAINHLSVSLMYQQATYADGSRR